MQCFESKKKPIGLTNVIQLFSNVVYYLPILTGVQPLSVLLKGATNRGKSVTYSRCGVLLGRQKPNTLVIVRLYTFVGFLNEIVSFSTLPFRVMRAMTPLCVSIN